jgi:hypothetical protein
MSIFIQTQLLTGVGIALLWLIMTIIDSIMF